MTESYSVADKLPRVERNTLADVVYSEIKELILSGLIAPGERLTLRRLAAAVGTSPMPVRDAVSRLVAEKALEMLPNRSIQVSWPSRERFEEIIAIRCTVEGLAAEAACRRRTEAELNEIKREAEMFETFAHGATPDPMEAMRANRRMHFAIYRAAGMPTLLQIIEALWLQVGPVFWASVGGEIKAHAAGKSASDTSEMLDTTYRSHAALVNAIEARDGERARQAVVNDVEKAAVMIVRSGRLNDAEGWVPR
ncbi:GntR family transcriptional regulator [Agrobacterium rhizogenes]|uniref:HTH gntR-type domain-containing protein n=1 Tax=Rhizobium rhizogenes NBRC 13257 TaxID=1220581 RepID=A0AA87Q7N4_RHIRH|nr:GntR family transcriptional regulator [Rhizobium rhizogenes]NTF59622.1 GntR family transcriptional regulator [Rhizobium rhizogenes]NTF65917.1 GntR family transcriptional regulator [Rhizobium rhizogenes]NTF79182.1 GntR family transcriptional regulator [Rhizobium rhizogenes]NTF96021.1 GntR family transcriptional regulator [Rhizobium rhizogenes]NTG04834.1 GntR family transcriptional regulator [Rhizobium rhizogenes]